MLGYYSPPPQPAMHNWQGQSGQWYVFTIYPIYDIPSFIRACNYIFARPKFDGTREPFYIGESGDFNQELTNHKKIGPARRLGATEVHIHFSANSRWDRLDIETDLRRGHWTPLNEQPTPALPSGLGALASLGIAPSPSAGFGALNSLATLPPAPPTNTLAGFGGWESPFGFGTDLDALLRSIK